MSHNHPSAARPEEIYRKLESGLGHELVDDGNVDALIQMAHQKGNATIETILREWRAPCADPATDVPPGGAATGSFNSTHVKH